MSTPHRRFIQGPLTRTLARPALRDEVMRALLDRPQHERALFIDVDDLQRSLAPRDWGVWSTLQSLAEYDLVELFERDRTFGRPARVLLTSTGRRWKPNPEGEVPLWQDEPMRFAYQVDDVLTAGTLEDWAKAWEQAQYAGDPHLSTTLLTWRNREGYPVAVDRLCGLHGDEDGYIRYRVWAAGDIVHVCLDGRA